MIEKLGVLSARIGNTPLMQLEDTNIRLFTKLEFQNLMGSVKVRPAYHIIKEAILRGEITEETTVIESTSGNFGIALATICKFLGLKFIAVVDANVNLAYENVLRAIAYDVVKVTERDHTGGYLLNRVATVQRLCEEIENSFWTNQYANKDNFMAHYLGLGTEIAQQFDQLDYAFIGVSSGGTISGVSKKLKEAFPTIKIVAVDIEGSVIFGQQPKKRYIPGIGSSMVPAVLQNAVIDEVVIISEVDTVRGCQALFEQHAIFAGGSSGTSYFAVQQYFQDKSFTKKPNVLFLCPDGGASYVDTVYNAEWQQWLIQQADKTVVQA